MVDDTLKKLLDAEKKAEQMVEDGKARRDEISRKAVEDAHNAEAHFSARVPEIQNSFLEKARHRADQSISELELRYDERKQELKQMAEEHREEAVEAALALITSRIKG
jgi:vacuolar-type H+-ATPase subunit H